MRKTRPASSTAAGVRESHNIANDTDEDIAAVFIKRPHDPNDKVAVE
jgi:hypothetical protein